VGVGPVDEAAEDYVAEKLGFDDEEEMKVLFGDVCDLLFAYQRVDTDNLQYIHLYKHYLLLWESIDLKGS
jgi:hypothetical protein